MPGLGAGRPRDRDPPRQVFPTAIIFCPPHVVLRSYLGRLADSLSCGPSVS